MAMNVVHVNMDLPEWHTMRWDCVVDYDEVIKFETLLKYMGIKFSTKTEDAMDDNIVCGNKVTVGYWAYHKDNDIVKSAFKRYLESKEEE